MLTIEQAQVDRFPFKEGDQVIIRWASPKNAIDHGTIHKLHTGKQWGKHVVYAIMVLIEGHEKPCAVSSDCIFKICKQHTPTPRTMV